MKSLRFYPALWASKLSLHLMKLLGRNASYFPGSIALKICPDFLKHLTMPKTVVAVTGTNGKTTVSNLLTTLLRQCGYTVTNNDLGSNVHEGVVTALLADSGWTGKPTRDIAILEVDERSSLRIYAHLTPDYLVCNNIMRDSLKRNAHTEFITYIINKALPKQTKLILNADDMVCCTVGTQNPSRTYFGLDIEKPAFTELPFVRDIVYCPHCGTKLEPEYIRYNHIGRFRCPGCGKGSETPNFLVTDINRDKGTFTVTHHGVSEDYKLINDNVVNLYNFASAITVLHQLGLSYEQISGAFNQAEIVKTRYDSVQSGDLNITMQLAKGQNPIACGRAFSYVARCPGDKKAVYILIDDKSDNTNNVENICWHYDCDYSPLTDPSIGQIVFSGPRCKDQLLRCLMAGVDPAKIQLWPGFEGGTHLVDTDTYKDIYVLYDVYSTAEAARVKQAFIEKGAR